MGAPAGDLYLRVVVKPHEFFERRGDDLYTKIPVTVAEATLGAKIEVPTIDGRSLVRIPPGTNSGKTLRLKEKGVPRIRVMERAATSMWKFRWWCRSRPMSACAI